MSTNKIIQMLEKCECLRSGSHISPDIYRVRFWLKNSGAPQQCFILCLTLQLFKVTIPLMYCHLVDSTKIVHQVLMQSRSNYGSNKWYIIGHQWIFIFNSRSGTSMCKNPSSTPSQVTSEQVTVSAANGQKHLWAKCGSRNWGYLNISLRKSL